MRLSLKMCSVMSRKVLFHLFKWNLQQLRLPSFLPSFQTESLHSQRPQSHSFKEYPLRLYSAFLWYKDIQMRGKL